MIVINKPASIPVHPTGRYRHNTVVQIMQEEMGTPALFPVNRLDRLTSGLVMLALDAKKATEMMLELKARTVSKRYLCRVKGEFPEGEVECAEPIMTALHKVGINLVSPDGKGTTFI